MSKTTKTHYVHWFFCEHADIGYTLAVFDCKMEDKDNIFVCEIEVEPIDKRLVVEKGVEKLDSDILDLKKQIKNIEEKKQQLLAIEFQE